MFFIHPESGMPKINGEKSGQLSEEYKKLLEESEGLPLETLERVSAACGRSGRTTDLAYDAASPGKAVGSRANGKPRHGDGQVLPSGPSYAAIVRTP